MKHLKLTIFKEINNWLLKAKKYNYLIILLCLISPSKNYCQSMGNAFNFDGINDYIQVNSDSSFNLTSSTISTIELWVKLNGNHPSFHGLVAKGGAEPFYQLAIKNNRFAVEIATSSMYFLTEVNQDLNDGKWHHLACSFNRSTPNYIKLYVDGELKQTASTTILSSSLSNNVKLVIGTERTKSIFFKGSIDEIRIWDIERSQAQLQNNLNTLIPSNTVGLSGLFRFEDGNANANNSTLNDTISFSGSRSGKARIFNAALSGNISNFTKSYAGIKTTILLARKICAKNASILVSTETADKNQALKLEYANNINFSPSSTILINPIDTLIEIGNLNPQTTYYVRALSYQTDRADSSIYCNTFTFSTSPNPATSGTLPKTLYVGQTYFLPNTYSPSFSPSNLVSYESSTGNLQANQAGAVWIQESVTFGACINTVSQRLIITHTPGRALSFNHANLNYVSAPNKSHINFDANQNFTVECWFRTTDTRTNFQGLVSKGGITGNYYQLAIHQNKLFGELRNSGLTNLVGTTLVNDGRWHHVAMVINKTSNIAQLYLDGKLETSVSGGAGSTQSHINTSPLKIGVERETGIFFNGLIDEVRIWSSARTLSEIQNTLNDTVASNAANLVAYYRFDDGAGNNGDSLSNQLIDYTSNNNHGTLTNYNLTSTSPWRTSVAMVQIKNLTSTTVCNGQFSLNWNFMKHGAGLTLQPDVSIYRNFSSLISTYSQVLPSNSSPAILNYTEANPALFLRLRYLSNDNTGESLFSDTIEIKNAITRPIIGNTNLTIGSSIQLSHDSAGGIWSSNNLGIATVSATGLLTTISPGQVSISYTINNGTCLNSVLKRFNIQQPQGNALSFSGASRTSISGTLSTLPTGNTQRSVSMYIKPQTGFGTGSFLTYGTNNLNKEYLTIGMSNFRLRVLGNSYSILSNTSLLQNQWNHIAVTYSGGSPSNIKLYVNFVLDTSITVTFNTLGSNFILGASFSSEVSEFFSGEMDELKIWNKLLTNLELNESRFIDTIANANLIAHYSFNQGYALQNNLLENSLINAVGALGNGTLNNFRLQDSITNYTLSYALPGVSISGLNNVCFNNAGLNLNPNRIDLMNSYQIELSERNDFSTYQSMQFPLSVSITSLVQLENLLSNRIYYVRIRATNSNTNQVSAPSGVFSFSTLNGPAEITVSSQLYKGKNYAFNANNYAGVWQISNPLIGSINSSTGLYSATDTGYQTFSFTYVLDSCTINLQKTIYVNSIPGSAFNFLGTTNTTLEAKHHSSLNAAGGSISIEFWFQTIDDKTGFYGMISKGNTGGMFQIAKFNNKLCAEIRTTNNVFIQLTSSASINDGKWHHAALVIDMPTNNKATLYLDGRAVQTVSNSNLSNGIDNLMDLKIGVERLGTFFYVGRLDEIKIWKSAKSQGQIRQLMFDTANCSDNDLAAYYRFDDGAPYSNNSNNRTLRDFSLNQNHANFNANFALNGTENNFVLSMAMLEPRNLSVQESCGTRAVISYEAPLFAHAESCVLELVTDSNSMETAISPYFGSNRSLAGNIELLNLNRNTRYYWRLRPKNNALNEVAQTTWMVLNTSNCNEIWTGAHNSAWSNPQNWLDLSVPQNGSTIRIPVTSNAPILTGKVIIDSLIIDSASTLSLPNASSDTLSIINGISGKGSLKGHKEASLQLLSSKGNYSIRFLQSADENNRSLKNLLINNFNKSINLENELLIWDRLTITGGFFNLSSAGLILKASATKSANIGIYGSHAGEINGPVSLEIYVPGRRAFRFISQPFTSNISFQQVKNSIFITGNGGLSNGFDPSASNNSSLFSYNPSIGNISQSIDPGWQAVSNLNSQAFEVGKGYRILIRGTRNQLGTLSGSNETPRDTIIRLTGTINDGWPKTINLQNGTQSQFNLIGNPFAAPIDLSKATFNNCKSNVYFYDPWRGTRGGFYAANRNDANIIPVGSAFFIEQNNVGAASILFPTDMKTFSGNLKSLHKTSAEKLHIQLLTEDSVIWDEFSLVHNQNLNGDFDSEDARKLNNPEVNLFSKSNQLNALSIDVRNIENISLPLYLTSTTNGAFILDFSKSTLSNNKRLWLNYKGESVEISNSLRYKVNLIVSNDTLKPFLYITESPASFLTEQHLENKWITPYPNPFKNEIILDEKLFENGFKSITVSDIMGRVVYKDDAIKSKSKLTLSEIPKGIYLITIEREEQKINYRIIKE